MLYAKPFVNSMLSRTPLLSQAGGLEGMGLFFTSKSQSWKQWAILLTVSSEWVHRTNIPPTSPNVATSHMSRHHIGCPTIVISTSNVAATWIALKNLTFSPSTHLSKLTTSVFSMRCFMRLLRYPTTTLRRFGCRTHSPMAKVPLESANQSRLFSTNLEAIFLITIPSHFSSISHHTIHNSESVMPQNGSIFLIFVLHLVTILLCS